MQGVGVCWRFWIGTARVESFSQEISTLMKNWQISHNSRLASLSPFLGGDEVASVVGWKGQISIPKSKPYYVFTMSRIALSLWTVTKMKWGCWTCADRTETEVMDTIFLATLRNILHLCSSCKRRKVKPEPTRWPPKGRIPISKVGVDSFRPLKVKHISK